MAQTLLTRNQDLTKEILHFIGKQYRIVPLNSLKHPKYRLNTPVIIQLYEDLKADKENLGPLPQKWFEYLDSHLMMI